MLDGTDFSLPYITLQKDLSLPHNIVQISPAITPHARSFVHHILAYLCPNTLQPSDVGMSRPCHQINESLRSCYVGVLIGAWAVGGDVSYHMLVHR